MADSNKTHQLKTRVEPDLAAKVEAAAEVERRTVSAWLRNLIADRLANTP